MTSDNILADVEELLGTVQVLRRALRMAVERYEDLEARITPGHVLGLTPDELERHQQRMEDVGLEDVDVWFCAMLDDLQYDSLGRVCRGGGYSDMYERVGADKPMPHASR